MIYFYLLWTIALCVLFVMIVSSTFDNYKLYVFGKYIMIVELTTVSNLYHNDSKSYFITMLELNHNLISFIHSTKALTLQKIKMVLNKNYVEIKRF